MFDLNNKVALITGGASGLGLCYAKELLRNNVKGVVLADINDKAAEQALIDIENEFGKEKAIFVKTDVTNKDVFEAAFVKTIETFKNIDILINNAGIYDDFNWEKEVDINVKGTINGLILGLEKYLKKYKQGDSAVILNTASVAGLRPGPWMPIYGCTKFAIIGMTQNWGHSFHYERTNVRVVAVCPGGTLTSLFNLEKCALNDEYMVSQKSSTEKHGILNRQSPEFVAKEAIKIIKYGDNGSLWVVEAGEPAYKFVYPERQIFKHNVIRES